MSEQGPVTKVRTGNFQLRRRHRPGISRRKVFPHPYKPPFTPFLQGHKAQPGREAMSLLLCCD